MINILKLKAKQLYFVCRTCIYNMISTLILKDIIMIGIISVLFGVIYLGVINFGIFIATILTPFGLAPLVYEALFGVWIMAGTIAPYIIRKKGVGIISEMIASLIEVLLGNIYGPQVFLYGFFQGLGAEMGFALFGYKKYNILSMSIGSAISAVFGFILQYILIGYPNINQELLIIMFITKIISAIIFGGIITKFLADRLAKAGVLKSYPIGENYTVDLEG